MRYMICFYTYRAKEPEQFLDEAELFKRMLVLKKKKVKFVVCEYNVIFDFS